jgi:hypothetical protein
MADYPHFEYRLARDQTVIIRCMVCRSIISSTKNDFSFRALEESHQCLVFNILRRSVAETDTYNDLQNGS